MPAKDIAYAQKIVSSYPIILKEPKYNNVKIIVKFKITGVKAIAANLLIVLRKPPIKEDKETNIRNGKVILERRTVSLNFSGLSLNPGAIIFINRGIKISIRITRGSNAKKVIDKILVKNIVASRPPFLTCIPDKTGTKAEFIAPSAKSLLNKLGNLKATKNESDMNEAPKYLAKRKSLKYPRILLKNVNEPIVEAIFKIKLPSMNYKIFNYLF